MTIMHELYREHLLDHYRHPRNAAPLTHPDAVAEEHNPLCGDRVRAEAKFSHGRVVAVTLETRGCVIATAAGSLLSEWAIGKHPAEIAALDYAVMQKILGATVGAGRAKCLMLPLEALRHAVGNAKTKR